jgi:hypothetical protein
MRIWLPMRSYEEAEKMKNRERGTHRSLVDGGGTTAASVQKKIQSPCNAAERKGGGGDGGVVNGDAGRRRASAPEWSGSSAALLLCPLVRRRSARGRRAEEEEGTVAGVKRASLPPPHIYTEEAGSWGSWVVLHSPDRFCGEAPRGGTEWGGGSCNRAMTQ